MHKTFLSQSGGDRKYKSIEREQNVIGILSIVKGAMFKFYRNKELVHIMWEPYMLLF